MVKKTNIVEAAAVISDALKGFVGQGESGNVHVFESSAGNLRVIIGSDRFKGKGPAECQRMIWDYLEKNVPTEQLMYCSGVHPMDAAEYAAEMFGRTSSALADLFIRGTIRPNEVSDE